MMAAPPDSRGADDRRPSLTADQAASAALEALDRSTSATVSLIRSAA